MKTKHTPTPDQLSRLLTYDPDTGDLTWLPRPEWMFPDRRSFASWNSKYSGQRTGTKNGAGYLLVCVGYSNYYAHRIAWTLFHGAWPESLIDHRDGIRHNNKIKNLRDVTQSINMQNQRSARSGSQTMMIGAVPRSDGCRYQSQIKVGERVIYLGSFDTPDEAHQTYVEAKRRLHEGCTI